MKKSSDRSLRKRLSIIKRRVKHAERNLSEGKEYPIRKLEKRIEAFNKRLAFNNKITFPEIPEKRGKELGGLLYRDYLQTPEWREKSRLVREFYHNRCALCNSSKNLNVHHRTYWNRGNELPEDLILLCNECHKKFHGIVE